MIFRIYHETLGGHVHMRMFAGKRDGALGKCGDLCMRVEEFEDFRSLTQHGQIEFRQENPRTRASHEPRDPNDRYGIASGNDAE